MSIRQKKKLFWLVTFILTVVGVFFVVYRNSTEVGRKRIWLSLRASIVIALASRGLPPQFSGENRILLDSPSILVKNNELKFLENASKNIVLTKHNNGNFFADGFTPTPSSLGRPSSPGSQTATGIGGSNPGQGGNPGSGGGNLAPKTPPNLADPNPKITARFDNSASNQNQKKKSKKKEYSQVMDQLENQKNQKVVKVQVGDKIYTIQNPNKKGALELQSELAELMYNDFRKKAHLF